MRKSERRGVRDHTVKLTDEEITKRLGVWKPVERDIPDGYMRRYVKYVGSAAKGAVLD